MSLLSEQDRQVVASRLAAITNPVKILFFTQTFDAPATVRVAKQVLDEVLGLSSQLSLEEVNFVLEKERAAQYGIEGVPALVLLRGDEDSRIRFLGAPAGYEFMSLIEALVIAGTGHSGLSDESKALIDQYVTGQTEIRVFVTPSCPHCPRAVTLAHRMAAESPLISATCIDATEFIDLAHRYQVTGVPKTVVNDSIEMLGALPEQAFVSGAVNAPAPERSSPS